MHPAITPSIAAWIGNLPIRAAGGLSTMARSSAAPSPENARLPLTISYSKVPKEKISLRQSGAPPETCSGERYGRAFKSVSSRGRTRRAPEAVSRTAWGESFPWTAPRL
jgi:hypothetical protein